jgi:hypothetical protein
MERFYVHMREGEPKAEALRLAQMELRSDHSEPYYWAGFVLVGDPGRGPPNSGAGFLLWLVGGAGALAILGAAAMLFVRARRRKLCSLAGRG